jgi:hypothetical protein
MSVAKSGNISAVSTVNLGNAGAGYRSRWLIQFKNNAFTGSVTIKGQPTGGALGYVATYYLDMADGTNKATAITGAALILADASGLDIQLDVTAASAGSLDWEAAPMED